MAERDLLVKAELDTKQQLSAPLPADMVEYQSSQLSGRPAAAPARPASAAAAAAGALSEDVSALISSVRSMGCIVSNFKDTGTNRMSLSCGIDNRVLVLHLDPLYLSHAYVPVAFTSCVYVPVNSADRCFSGCQRWLTG